MTIEHTSLPLRWWYIWSVIVFCILDGNFPQIRGRLYGGNMHWTFTSSTSSVLLPRFWGEFMGIALDTYLRVRYEVLNNTILD